WFGNTPPALLKGGIIHFKLAIRTGMVQTPHFLKKTVHSGNTCRIPGLGLFQWHQEHLVQTQAIRPILLADTIRTYHIVFGLGHFFYFAKDFKSAVIFVYKLSI